MTPIFVAFGSNLGNCVRQIQEARVRLSACLVFDQESQWYQTEPMYELNQPPFLNGMWKFFTELGPAEVLAQLKKIEFEMGRQPSAPNAPRPIDLDLIAYGSLCYHHELAGRSVLVLPHPRAHERRFVLQPWHDLDPHGYIPGTNRTVAGSLAEVHSQIVNLYVENAKSVE